MKLEAWSVQLYPGAILEHDFRISTTLNRAVLYSPEQALTALLAMCILWRQTPAC